MSESDQKPSATTHSKTQAFNLEAMQLLVASTPNSVTELTKKLSTLETTSAATDKKLSKVMKKMDIHQVIQDDC
jgi:hypothetical protein